MATSSRPFPRFKRGGGYRSGSEKKLAAFLEEQGVHYAYEKTKLYYTKPATKHYYKPDWILTNGIILETKGLFESSDRQKMATIKSQYPNLDIRFVFDKPNQPIYKGSGTSIAEWADKYGFPWCGASDRGTILDWANIKTEWDMDSVTKYLEGTKADVSI
jgi:hypothetical protein